MSDLGPAVDHFHTHGYVLLPAYLGSADLKPAQDELPLLFPTPEEFHSGVDPERNARFSGSAFSGIDPFPYEAVQWSLLGLSQPIVELAEALLGTTDIRLYEAHNWAKYGGATEYDQELHRDYGNHTSAVPSDDPEFGEVEMFVYIHDVPVDCGPTYVVSQQHSAHVPIWPSHPPKVTIPVVYEREVPAAGPAGTVLAYKTSTLHRGSAITDPLGSRFAIKVSYRTNRTFWEDKLHLMQRMGKPWWKFVNAASPRQLELVGFPPRGHRYWTEQTWAGVCLRYPEADFSEFRPTSSEAG